MDRKGEGKGDGEGARGEGDKGERSTQSPPSVTPVIKS